MSTFQSIEARTGQAFGPQFQDANASEIDAAVRAAHAAFADWQASDGERRAALLEGLAAGLEAEREALVALADQESGLGLPRLNGGSEEHTSELQSQR